jgi:hypothetical protein
MSRTETQVFHRQRYREAVGAIGKIGSHVMESAVCREIALEQSWLFARLGQPGAGLRGRHRAHAQCTGGALRALGSRMIGPSPAWSPHGGDSRIQAIWRQPCREKSACRRPRRRPLRLRS